MRKPEQIANVETQDLAGKTVLVTGSTSGIGREAALAFDRLGADVIVHGRDEERGAALVEQMENDATFVEADFSSLANVDALVEAVPDDLDYLVNNAGGVFSDTGQTADGYSYTMNVNHFAHFKLTGHVLDALQAGDEGAITVVSSGAHQGPQLDMQSIKTGDWSSWRAYQQSKLANLHFTYYLARHLDAADVRVNAMHPGAIPGSQFGRDIPIPIEFLGRFADVLPFINTVEDGAAICLYTTLATDGETGKYISDFEATASSEASYDEATQADLWELSEEYTETEYNL